MADLRVDDPKTTQEFTELLAAQGVKLPLRLSEHEMGTVRDAKGHDVLTVDHGATDEEADQFAKMVILAVNTCGGFQAVPEG